MKNLKPIFIHGIYTSDAKDTFKNLSEFFDKPRIFDYGFLSVIWAAFKNRGIAKDFKKLLGTIKGKKVVFAHSNGNAIAVRAARKGAVIDYLVCMNAALRVDTVFPDTIKNVFIIYTDNDRATRAAKFFGGVPLVQLFVPDLWGAMGTYGSNNNQANTKHYTSSMIDDHSDILSKEDLTLLMPAIEKWISDIELNQQ